MKIELSLPITGWRNYVIYTVATVIKNARNT
jgi:hypothetical protein